MKIYSIGAGRRWARTQEDAKRLSRELGVSFAAVDVPTDHAGLTLFLDSLARGNEPEDELVDDGDSPGAVAAQTLLDIDGPLQPQPKEDYVERTVGIIGMVERSIAETDAKNQLSADAVVDWVFEKARPFEVENVFSALGCRFHEMRKFLSRTEAR